MTHYKNVLLAASFVFVSMVVPVAAIAQSGSSTQDVQGLRTQLNQLKDQMDKLQATLNDLERGQAGGTQAPPTGTSGDGTIQTTQPPRQGETSKQVGEATSTYTTFSEDTVAAARFNNIPLDPKYKGFF